MIGIKVQSDVELKYSVKENGNIISYDLSWEKTAVKGNSAITFLWEVPLLDIFYRWYPGVGGSRCIVPDWESNVENSIASNAPMVCFLNQKGENKYTVALSEFKKLTRMNFGVNEKTAGLSCRIELPLQQFLNSDTDKTTFAIKIDDEARTFEEAVEDVGRWWETSIDVMDDPDFIRDTFYSFWYSYHQDITPEIVEKECENLKGFGINAVIVDDGWQTRDNNGGYAYCGDWKPLKFPNMKEHIERVHNMGLKYILWYSVPFIGLKAESYPQFMDKTLYNTRGAAVLDPRYKKVREYLISTYEKALMEWGLDGFKLDFIDEFKNVNNIPANDMMDIKDLYDAVFTLMTDIKNRIKAIKEDIAIEFRQTYIGPAMRSYGNFFRVGDCPNDFIRNRVHSLDLRLLSLSTPIHSDMLMWNKNECVENCALQIINVIFSILQISVKLKEQSEEHKKMLKFWLNFTKENKDILQKSKLKVYDLQNLYTLAEGIEKNKKISAVYTPDKCVKLDKAEVIAINGTQYDYIIAEFIDKYICDIYNCMGEKVREFRNENNGIYKISVPSAGLVIARKIIG